MNYNQYNKSVPVSFGVVLVFVSVDLVLVRKRTDLMKLFVVEVAVVVVAVECYPKLHYRN
jgi:hypothetical protein